MGSTSDLDRMWCDSRALQLLFFSRPPITIVLATAPFSNTLLQCCYCPVKASAIPVKTDNSYGWTRSLSSSGLYRRGNQRGPPPEIQGGFSYIYSRYVVLNTDTPTDRYMEKSCFCKHIGPHIYVHSAHFCNNTCILCRVWTSIDWKSRSFRECVLIGAYPPPSKKNPIINICIVSTFSMSIVETKENKGNTM